MLHLRCSNVQEHIYAILMPGLPGHKWGVQETS